MLSIISPRSLLASLFFLILTLGFVHAASPPARVADDLSAFLMNCPFDGVPRESIQLLVVTGNTSGPSSATVHALEKNRSKWRAPFPPLTAVVGRNGFAGPEAKREGDGKTPSGVYPLMLAFGYTDGANTRMPYRKVTDDDLWVDDPGSPDYNKLVKRGETKAGSFEEMKRKDGLYRYGLVIGYNTDPVVRGYGSAIFLHIWKRPNSPTSGCVAMAEKDVLRVLEWLDPAKKPLIVMGTAETVLKFAR
jgi:L,D-peptidoglycan transpeptidase YkuD (ErfK/YbiS/YcfS/YnhG family)